MFENFWQDRAENGGRNSYWAFFDGKNLTPEESQIHSFMEELEKRYASIYLTPLPRMNLESLKHAMTKASPDVLEGLTRCCLLTNIFIPIKEITVGDWEKDFSYEQRFAMWRGANFKGASSYGTSFINEALNKNVPAAQNLWEKHCQMKEKMPSVEQVYATSITESMANPKKVSLWSSTDPQAKTFRTDVFSNSTFLRELFEKSSIKTVARKSSSNYNFCKENSRSL